MAIKDIRHKGLKELWERGRTGKIQRELQSNAVLIMDYLHRMRVISDCAGFKEFHPLKGKRKGQYTMHVSGNWCITFDFDGRDVTILDLEDYH